MKALICGGISFSQSDEYILNNLGITLSYMQSERDSVLQNPEEYEIVVCNWLFVYRPIELFTSLKAVHLLSAGLDRIPMNYITEHNIKLYHARGVYSIPMAEFAVMSVLEIYKKADCFYENRLWHRWEKQRDIEELSEKTVCVFGVGSVGSEVGKRFSVFCKKVIGVDLFCTEKPYFEKIYAFNECAAALKDADIIVITLPLTDITNKMFDNKMFRQCKRGVVLVNIARGGLINENDLKTAIDNGIIRAAVLDVQENEPLPMNHWMWEEPGIRITPHNSFVSNLNEKRLREMIIQNITDWMRRERQI